MNYSNPELTLNRVCVEHCDVVPDFVSEGLCFFDEIHADEMLHEQLAVL